MFSAILAILLIVLGPTKAFLVTSQRLSDIGLGDVPEHVIDSGVLNDPVVFGYTYESGVGADKIDLGALTHLVLAFFQVDALGNVNIKDNNIQNLIHEAHKRNVKVIASIGGDGDGSKSLSMALEANTTRYNLAASLVSIIKRFDMDGADYDLEFPENAQQLDSLYAGLKAMRAALNSAFGNHAKTLTMTLYSSKGQFGPELESANNTRVFSDLVDYGLLMSYDYFGGFSKTSAPNSPFYDIPEHPGLSFTSSINAWLRAGWDAKKLVAGLPYYGRTAIVETSASPRSQFMSVVGSAPPGGPISKIPGAWTWNDLRDPENGALSSATKPRNGWQRFWDNTTLTPWLLHNSSQTYIGYDDPDSLTIKASYIINSGLVGAMVWMTQYDFANELSAVMRNYSTACRRISALANSLDETALFNTNLSIDIENSEGDRTSEFDYTQHIETSTATTKDTQSIWLMRLLSVAFLRITMFLLN
ncbi:hypothetical protein COEREDRAFT_7721 [Coemansia reversa NRRL 1564]|uniref:GH18 domain-containing protein n=1 Tax=Coemansia reversa (strain ATCC 12441 / NRRL 1564) TaxID=763665 RepID=A0A2G5BEC5_COERN|nr:hypothetical protein COEREDRAFT_7721 [Coemansia reversa NRRL 1564]|eukprot:PIA17376.1 hypothetical protein COEREDRAFT_7721 [Coemansia reversa NRRL 1564]